MTGFEQRGLPGASCSGRRRPRRRLRSGGGGSTSSRASNSGSSLDGGAPEWEQRCRPAMAIGTTMASGEQGGEQEGVRGNGEESEGALVLPNSHRQEQAAAAADEVRRSALAWRTRSGHVFPLKHFVVQVACSEVVKVGRRFGLLLGRIGPWSKNKVCSSCRALQLSLRVLYH